MLAEVALATAGVKSILPVVGLKAVTVSSDPDPVPE